MEKGENVFVKDGGVVGGALHNSICVLAVLGINNVIHRKAIVVF